MSSSRHNSARGGTQKINILNDAGEGTKEQYRIVDDIDVIPLLRDRVLENYYLEDELSLFEEYQEVAESFAFLCFFFAVCPTMGLWSFVHILSETKSDAWKFRNTQRRIYRAPRGSGSSVLREAFTMVFELIGVVAIVVNMFLLIRRLGFTAQNSAFFYVIGLEHVLIFLKLYLASYVPQTPEGLEIMAELDAHRRELQLRIPHKLVRSRN